MNNDDKLIGQITKIRELNNLYWMEIVKLSLKHAPVETRHLLGMIKTNDYEIADLTDEIAHADSEPQDRT